MVVLPITISLLISIASAGAGDSREMAPITLPPWPQGLSSPIVRGEETCLLRDLADAVHYRLAACEQMPGRCEARIRGAIATCKADAYAEHVGACVGDGGAPPPPWLAAVGGVALGIAAGVAIGLTL